MSGTIKTIIVATDFSENANRALQWAISLGQQHQSRIVLVHAMEPAGAGLEAIADSLREESQTLLKESEQLVKEADLQSGSAIHRGQSWKVVADAAKQHAADLIVIGTRGRTGYKRVLLGSAADRLIRTANVPVLVIHPNDAIPSHGVRTILAAVDFSEESSLATSMAVRLVCENRKGSSGQPTPKLILLHTVELMVEWPTPDMPTVLPRYWNDTEAAAKRQLESIAASLRCDRLNVEIQTIRGYAPEVIEQQARDMKADLIALGTRGQSGLSRLMVGSVAASVLQHVPCPVLTVRKPGVDDPVQLESQR